MVMAFISPEGQIAGLADESYEPEGGYFKVPLPAGFADDDFDFLRYADNAVSIDVAAKEFAIYKASVPKEVTMRQARLALFGAGLLSGVDAAIASLPEPDKTVAAIEWEFAQTVDRNAGLVPAMAGALGMTERQIDDLFIQAATL